ncbi:MAG: tail fiber domain-containing protein [Betaproteobacteria bacterium]
MGGKSQPAPDYSAMAAANKYAADVSMQLGTRQMDFAEQQYADMLPLAQQVASQQMAAQDQQMAQAQDYYNYNVNTFRPLEQGLVADAQRFNTESYREQMAQKAAADVQQAFQGAQGVSMRNATRMGINPNSGAFGAAQSANALKLAAATAGAQTNARTQAEQMGWARRLDAAGLGRGLAGASSAAYGGAVGAGSAGLNSAMSAGNQYSQTFGQGANYQLQGAQMGIQGAGNILNSQTSVYNTGLNAQAEVTGALIGAGTTAAFKYSDRRLKENIELVGRDDRTGLHLYEFEYSGGTGRRFRGVMADDVEKQYPDMVYTMPDGFKAVNYAGLGIEMVGV